MPPFSPLLKKRADMESALPFQAIGQSFIVILSARSESKDLGTIDAA